ncbi:hypothetical protein [Actinomadura rupiterrae]|uniref:hypothetical protein n=1 Tax=Actinomadura rupiterrae TaxID=559627 RepID=UPI0020A3835E|nr:hypothetical protein [Actinomadura rupiterrae]MCP2339679.1 hypothetical protein [Actinomadura rupiterrae]
MTAVQQQGASPPAPAPQGGPPAPPVPSGSVRPGLADVRARAAAMPPRRGIRRAVPRTNSGRIRALSAGVVVVLAGLLLLSWNAVHDARTGVKVIGTAGPQVIATGDLYFRLTDMDAQLAHALLVGAGPAHAADRDQALTRYDGSRSEADKALVEAARLARDDTEKQTARSLLDALGRYERLAGQALLLDQRSPHAAGPPSAAVTQLYRQATDLMKLELLPQAYNLTLDNGTIVRHTYEDKRSAVLTGRTVVLVVGFVLLVLLGGFQLFMTRRFRRLLNLPLALTTVAVLVVVAWTATMLSGEASSLAKAKHDGFDSILALARARAIGNSAQADQTRFLLDPGRADTYEQVFQSKSQTVLYLKADNLADYQNGVKGLGTLQSPRDKPLLGFLGDEGRRPGGSIEGLNDVLHGFQRFQQNDRQMRDLVAHGQRDDAIALQTGQAATDYTSYDKSVVKLAAVHQATFDKAMKDGKGGTKGWQYVLPVAGLVVLLLLVAGIRPRLAEYR